MDSERAGPYVVTVKYALWHQSWPDVFGLFDGYDAAKVFADASVDGEAVIGYVIDKVLEPTRG